MKINNSNRNYYLNKGTHLVPNILSSATPIQESLRLEIESCINKNPIKVLELGFGSLPNRYIYIASRTKREWKITLTDFSLAILPPLSHLPLNSNLEFNLAQFDLLNPVFPDKNYDIILSTYTLDSVDFSSSETQVNFIKDCITHLTPNGLFITIDKITNQQCPDPQMADQAFFRPQNLKKIASLLVNKKYPAYFLTLNDFLNKHHQSLPLDLSDHGCLIVGYKS